MSTSLCNYLSVRFVDKYIRTTLGNGKIVISQIRAKDQMIRVLRAIIFCIFLVSCKEALVLDKRNSKSTGPSVKCSELSLGDICWSKSFGGSSSDAINAIGLSGDDIVFCGYTRNTYTVDGILVDANTTNQEFFTGKCSKNNCDVDWIKTAGKVEGRSFCAGVGTDSSGNVYAGGTYYTNLDFGGGLLGNNGDRDMALVKYNTIGTYDWAIGFGGIGGEELNSLAVTPGNDILTSGFFRNTVDFGSGNVTSNGDSDAFISKYNSAGTSQFSSVFGLAQKDYFWDVVSDSSNNIYATGEMIGNINLGGGALTAIGARDIFVGKYGPTGTHTWSIVFGGTGEEYTRDLAVNTAGEVIVAGTSKGAFNVGGIGHTNQGGSDIILVKVNADSTIAWAKAFGSAGEDIATDVEFDNDGNIILTASFSGTLNMGGSNLVSNGSNDFLVAKYDSAGNHLFSKSFGGTGSDAISSLKIDTENNIILGGSFSNSINLGTKTLNSNGSNDHLIFKMRNK